MPLELSPPVDIQPKLLTVTAPAEPPPMPEPPTPTEAASSDPPDAAMAKPPLPPPPPIDCARMPFDSNALVRMLL